MVFEHENYRSYLKSILVDRIQKNEAYSLRAFASQIGIAPGMLSEVFQGRKDISLKKAMTISGRLNLPNDEENYFVNLVQLENAKGVLEREKILNRLQSLSPEKLHRDLSIDHYHTVANWVCSAGFALLGTSQKGLSAKEIGNRLGITPFEAEAAMEHWIRLDLVEKRKDRYCALTDQQIMLASPTPHSAVQKFHLSMLQKAMTALDTQTRSEKFVGSETFSFDPKDLPEISKILEDAVAKVLTKAKKNKNRSEVYHLGFQFFRLTEKGKS